MQQRALAYRRRRRIARGRVAPAWGCLPSYQPLRLTPKTTCTPSPLLNDANVKSDANVDGARGNVASTSCVYSTAADNEVIDKSINVLFDYILVTLVLF